MPTPIESAAAAVAEGLAVFTAWGVSVDQMNAWLRGTATGGPNGDGRYPITNRAGTTVLVACPAKMEASIAGEYGAAVDQLRRWLGGMPFGGPAANGTYPVTLETGQVMNLPCPRKLAAMTQSIDQVIAGGSLIALTDGRNFATEAALLASTGASDGDWALVHSDPLPIANGFYLRASAAWTIKVVLSSEALLTALGANLMGPVLHQVVGREGDPLDIGAAISTDQMFIWNDPVTDPCSLRAIRLYAVGTGTMQLARYSKSGTTVTKQAHIDVPVTTLGLQTIAVDFPLDANDYVGLTGQGIWTSTSNPADGAGFWNVIASLDVRTVGTAATANRLEVGFDLKVVDQAVNAVAFATMQEEVSGLLTGMVQAAAAVAALHGSVTQRIGITGAPILGNGGVSDQMFIWADAVAMDGVLQELVFYAATTGTLKLAAYSRDGTTVTRTRTVDIPVVTTGDHTLTSADFGSFTLLAGQHLGIAGTGIFTSSLNPADGTGWWQVNAAVPVRTVGTPTTSLRIEARFTVDQPIQYVTAERLLAISDQGADHEIRLAAAEPKISALSANRVQTVGRPVAPETGTPVLGSVYIWNAPIDYDGTLEEMEVPIVGTGDLTLVRWSRVGSAIHREDVRTIAVTPGALLLGPDDFGGPMPFKAGNLIGLAGEGLFTSTSNAADQGGWWQVVNGLDDRTLGTLLTGNRLEASFRFAQIYQAATADAVIGLQTRMDEMESAGVSVTGGTLADVPDWLYPDAAAMKAPIFGGRKRVKRSVGRRVLASMAAVADVRNGGSITGLSDETTDDSMYGATALKLVTTGGTMATLAPPAASSVPCDVRGGMIRWQFKPLANIFAAIDRFSIELHSAGTPASPSGNYHQIVPTSAPFDIRQRLTSQNGTGRWQGYSVATAQFSAVGTGADLSAITFARLNLRSSSGNSMSLYIGNIEFVPNALPKAKAIISFDDGLIGQWTYAAPRLARYGFPAVLFPSPVAISVGVSPTYMTPSQIKRLHDDYGWQIGSQAWTTENLSVIGAMSENQFTSELAKLRSWHAAMGVTGGEHGSYFSGVSHQILSAYPAFRKHFRSMRSYFGGNSSAPAMFYGETFPYGDPLMIRALAPALLDVSNNGDLLIAHCQQAIANKGVAYFGYHAEYASAGNVQNGFNQLLAWLDANRADIDVCTEDDLYPG